jgi:archaellum component FlaG (FlaF/FlaG flagellin family)
MVYGPYTTEQGAGDYKATFYIKNSGNGTGFLAAIDAYNSNGLASKSLSFKIVQGSELTSTGYTPIVVNFTRTDTDGTMEYRVKNIGGTELTVDRIVVEQV